ncbi:MAG: hypothetical protein N838_12115 [Thiohalocapsa sp. PB-PSB1]|nr:MAG: hypothetical protein N838_12115 [Thiohalocapsa sp. PB-PSB1]
MQRGKKRLAQGNQEKSSRADAKAGGREEEARAETQRRKGKKEK